MGLKKEHEPLQEFRKNLLAIVNRDELEVLDQCYELLILLTGFSLLIAQSIMNYMSLNLNTFLNLYKIKSFQGKSAAGLQLINNVVNGSPNESVVPPILTGRLRGSGSVFVGAVLVGTSESMTRSSGATPAKSNNENNEQVVTIGFNTPYAAKWHEQEFTPGKFSVQSGDVGTKYLWKHAMHDAKEIKELFAKKTFRGLTL